MKKYSLPALFIILTFITAACTQKFKPAEYASTTGTASTGVEIQISLDDGASISIPEESINGDVSVKIERNPDKAKTLPPLPDGFVQVSDFYNFQITGGNLNGPVDLVFPFDKTIMPNEDGQLVALIPTGDGWKIMPVDVYEDGAYLYTTELGDPLIAWNFSDNPCPKQNLRITVTTIPDEVDWDTEIRVIGQVESKSKFDVSKPAGLPVTVKVNYWIESNTNNTLTGTTDKDGHFEFIVHPQKDKHLGFKEGHNGVVASVTCTDIFSYEAKNWHNFTIKTQTSETVSTQPVSPQPAQPPAAQTQPIAPPQSPTDKIPVPNVVGMTFEDAQATLENLGFNTTWIDGKSNLELGKIYSQAPVAGTLSVPHRSTVVIYRTTEVVQQPPECTQFNLTPEECINARKHDYNGSCEVISGPGFCQCGEFSVFTSEFSFNGTGVTYSFLGGSNQATRISQNTYSYIPVADQDIQGQGTLTFNNSGFIDTMIWPSGCVYRLENTLIR